MVGMRAHERRLELQLRAEIQDGGFSVEVPFHAGGSSFLEVGEPNLPVEGLADEPVVQVEQLLIHDAYRYENRRQS